MSNVETLLTRCRQLGVELSPTAHGTLKVRSPAPLPADLRQELKQRKPEVLPIVEAMTWLRSRLATTQHIAPLVAEWLGTIDNPTGRDVDALMSARWTLGVHAYVGEDSRFWWSIPYEREQ